MKYYRPDHNSIPMIFHQRSWNRGLERAALLGDCKLVNTMIERGALDWSRGFLASIEGGHMAILEYMLALDPQDSIVPKGAELACLHGFQEIAKHLISRLGNRYDSSNILDRLFWAACDGGLLEIVHYFISLGANSWGEGLIRGCKKGNIKMVDLLIENSAEERPYQMNCSLGAACYIGNSAIVDRLILNGATAWNLGLEEACKGGHPEIVERMIRLGANDWNAGLRGACKSGNWEIIDCMIQHGANDWGWALQNASWAGHLEIVQHMVAARPAKPSTVHSSYRWSLNESLCWAAFKGHLNVVEFLIQCGADDWNDGLVKACHGGHIKIVDHMIRQGATDFNAGLSAALASGEYEITAYMIDCGATHMPPDALEKVCEGGDYLMIELLLVKTEPSFYPTTDIDRGLYAACRNEHGDVIDLLVRHGAKNWEIGLQGACRVGNWDIAKRMIDLGARTEYALQYAVNEGPPAFAKRMCEYLEAWSTESG